MSELSESKTWGKEYEGRILGAPKRSWIAVMTRSWNKPLDDSVLLLIERKNDALKACDKNATQAGLCFIMMPACEVRNGKQR
jgi:hypothetical protein